MPDCIFCKIVNRESPADIVYKDEQVTAFQDVRPVSPVHLLIVPNKHIDSVNHIIPEDETMLGHLFTIARKLAEQNGISASGYRLIINTGAHAGQVVFHLHMHLMGGQRMRYPIG